MFDCEGPAFVGMVHLLPLPGAPRWAGDVQAVLDAASRDAERLLEGGCDALLVENMGDNPWLKGGVPPWTVAAMTRAVERVVSLGVPTGVQVLAAANAEALGIAMATGAAFVRVEGFAYAHVADEGWVDACAGPLLRQRASLGADVAIWADVHKKHSAHAVTGDLSLEDLAHGTAFAGADVLIATGTSTGEPTDPAHVSAMKSAGIPVAVGSGVTPENVGGVRSADALIVGSWLKEGGDWRAPVDVARVRRLRAAIG
ncbi:MAG: BtpA/SgcQ family protein [Alphaproteobacteria bacterium]|nr:BtpA/SgcQ family protein [Alphaproteobacteria bacterium]